LLYKTWYLTDTPIVEQKKRVPIRRSGFVNLIYSFEHVFDVFILYNLKCVNIRTTNVKIGLMEGFDAFQII